MSQQTEQQTWADLQALLVKSGQDKQPSDSVCKEIVDLINGLYGNIDGDELAKRLRQIFDETKPDLGFLNWTGLKLYQSMLYEVAILFFQFRIDHHKADTIGYNNMGLCYNRLADTEKAAAAYRAALKNKPDYKAAGSNLAYLVHYNYGSSPEECFELHKDYATRHCQQGKNWLLGKQKDHISARKIRIGYVSADLRNHAVSRFMEGLLQWHDRRYFEVFVYDNRNGKPDPIMASLMSLDVVWKKINAYDAEKICALIVEDGIDILVDLSGYTNGGLPEVFSHRVAPIQINYLGYPDTTAIKNVDYRITDNVSDPLGFDDYYSERLFRLPTSMWNYTPWPNMPEVAASPFLKNGFITFGSMNNHAKLQTQWLQEWARVLQGVPNSRLLIKSRAMNSQRVRDALLEQFAALGVENDRIAMRNYESSSLNHFKLFDEIDIAFDAFPYNGTTTTFDSLWMGVPVLSRRGELHVSRTTDSIQSEIGLADWVADDNDDFVAKAIAHAQDTDTLKQLRQSLRAKMNRTTLIGQRNFSSVMESAYRKMWQAHSSKYNIRTVADNQTVLPALSKHEVTEQQIQILHDDSNAQISLLICTADINTALDHVNHIRDTLTVPFQYIVYINRGERGLAASYNLLAEVAQADLLLFLHDDVYFTDSHWGQQLQNHFADNKDLGLVGLAGTNFLSSNKPYWIAAGRPHIYGKVIHHVKTRTGLSIYHDEESYEGDAAVVAIDGLFMAVRRDVHQQVLFDESNFTGFHFYDIDYSVRISEKWGVKVATDIVVKHLSGGNFQEEWKRARETFWQKHGRDNYWSVDNQKYDIGERVPGEYFSLRKKYADDQVKRISRLGLAHPKLRTDL